MLPKKSKSPKRGKSPKKSKRSASNSSKVLKKKLSFDPVTGFSKKGTANEMLQALTTAAVKNDKIPRGPDTNKYIVEYFIGIWLSDYLGEIYNSLFGAGVFEKIDNRLEVFEIFYRGLLTQVGNKLGRKLKYVPSCL